MEISVWSASDFPSCDLSPDIIITLLLIPYEPLFQVTSLAPTMWPWQFLVIGLLPSSQSPSLPHSLSLSLSALRWFHVFNPIKVEFILLSLNQVLPCAWCPRTFVPYKPHLFQVNLSFSSELHYYLINLFICLYCWGA